MPWIWFVPWRSSKNVNLEPGSGSPMRPARSRRSPKKQVLLNLLSNAIKFNRVGGSVVISCEETQAGRLRIEIVDTGSGISADGLQKIFRH